MEITTKFGKKIYVYDDLFSLRTRDVTLFKCFRSNYKLGWGDGETEDLGGYHYLHSMFSEQELEMTPFFTELQQTPAYDHVKDLSISQIVVNLATPCQANFLHAHPEKKVLLYYANTKWEEGWHGETHWYDEAKKEIEYSSPYVPGRLVIFDGSIPHTIRPQSYLANRYRFTLTILFD